MGEHEYTVKAIDGEYAVLREQDGTEVMIALFLLPDGTDVGTKLHCENFSYSILPE